jgi:hypothetical protein
MTTTEWIVLGCVYGFVIVAYCVGTYYTNKAVDDVREMDKHDDATKRYAEIERQMKVWTKGGGE